MIIRELGLTSYETVWNAMRQFTESRTESTPDELWVLQHRPVYTLGMAGRMEHVLAPGNIPVIHVDRGGQVTYHGPGQLVLYPLLDIRRSKLGPRSLVSILENSCMAALGSWGIRASVRSKAPGVYVEPRKIASIGLRFRKGGSYHGLALNVSMDLEPFQRINPCGFAGLQMTQVADEGGPNEIAAVSPVLISELCQRLNESGISTAPIESIVSELNI